MKYKGALRGVDHYNSKLNTDEVILIRKRRKNGMTFRYIADVHDMSVAQVHDICKRKAWRHVK